MKVLIADDHPILWAGLKEILAKENDLDFVGEAHNEHKVLELIRKQPWDVVVSDITIASWQTKLTHAHQKGEPISQHSDPKPVTFDSTSCPSRRNSLLRQILKR